MGFEVVTFGIVCIIQTICWLRSTALDSDNSVVTEISKRHNIICMFIVDRKPSCTYQTDLQIYGNEDNTSTIMD